jgi:hypothetical protein
MIFGYKKLKKSPKKANGLACHANDFTRDKKFHWLNYCKKKYEYLHRR